MTTLQSTLQSQRSSATQAQDADANAAAAEQLGAEASQDALWRMAQNNAMAKVRGFNSLAKSANDMA